MKTNCEMLYLWRAVDLEGEVLQALVTTTRDKTAAHQKAMKRHGGPQAIVTEVCVPTAWR